MSETESDLEDSMHNIADKTKDELTGSFRKVKFDPTDNVAATSNSTAEQSAGLSDHERLEQSANRYQRALKLVDTDHNAKDVVAAARQPILENTTLSLETDEEGNMVERKKTGRRGRIKKSSDSSITLSAASLNSATSLDADLVSVSETKVMEKNDGGRHSPPKEIEALKEHVEPGENKKEQLEERKEITEKELIQEEKEVKEADILLVEEEQLGVEVPEEHIVPNEAPHTASVTEILPHLIPLPESPPGINSYEEEEDVPFDVIKQAIDTINNSGSRRKSKLQVSEEERKVIAERWGFTRRTNDNGLKKTLVPHFKVDPVTHQRIPLHEGRELHSGKQCTVKRHDSSSNFLQLEPGSAKDSKKQNSPSMTVSKIPVLLRTDANRNSMSDKPDKVSSLSMKPDYRKENDPGKLFSPPKTPVGKVGKINIQGESRFPPTRILSQSRMHSLLVCASTKLVVFIN
jgi:hypothetical protein